GERQDTDTERHSDLRSAAHGPPLPSCCAGPTAAWNSIASVSLPVSTDGSLATIGHTTHFAQTRRAKLLGTKGLDLGSEPRPGGGRAPSPKVRSMARRAQWPLVASLGRWDELAPISLREDRRF